MGFDGTNKGSAGGGKNIAYHAIHTPYTDKLMQDAIGLASQEAVAFCDPENYAGPVIEVDAATLTEDEWQERRKTHLGGSDAAVVFGESHFKDNLRLYMEKAGEVPVVDEEESGKLFKLYGHLNEEYVAAWLAERYPFNEILIDTNIYALPGHEYITANIDRMMIKPDGSPCLVEIKTTSAFNKDAWKDNNVPVPYLYQVRLYMAILGVPEAIVVCMFDRDTFAVSRVTRDLDEEKFIIEGLIEFWERHVLAHIPPAPLGNPTSILDTLTAYTGHGDKSLPKMQMDTASFEALCNEYMSVSEQYKSAKALLDGLDAKRKELQIPFAAALGQTTEGEVVSSDGKTHWQIKYTPRKGRDVTDLKKLEAYYPKAYADCVSTGEEGRTFGMKTFQTK